MPNVIIINFGLFRCIGLVSLPVINFFFVQKSFWAAFMWVHKSNIASVVVRTSLLLGALGTQEHLTVILLD